MNAQRAWLIALFGSLLLWIATAAISGRAEPWDAGFYWILSYPLALVLAGVLGYHHPQRPWRWALVVIYSQMIIMLFSGGSFGLLPLGLIMLGVLSLPAIVAAKLGARWARRAGRAG